jgi:hypothetical protein
MSNDTEKRKTKVFKPQTGASIMIWASKAQDKINEIINPILLEFYSKKNLRSLSSIEFQEAEETRAKILFGLQPMTKIDNESVMLAFLDINTSATHDRIIEYKNWLKTIEQTLGQPLSVEDQKQAKASFYSLVYSS